MKRTFAFAIVLAIISVPAFAASHSQSVTMPETVAVAGTQLPAGQYKVTWTGSGSSVHVTLRQQGVHTPATATTQARLVNQNNGYAAVTTDTKAGVNTLEQIQLDHVDLVLSSGPSSGQ